jgi:hypothetical protein
MEKSYEHSFDRLEKKKENLLKKLSEQTAEVIESRKNCKWSPVEQCYHVHLAEKLSRKYCIKKLSFNPDLEDAAIKTSFRVLTLKIIEWTPFKFTAPKTINEQVFPESLNFDMMCQEWEKDREELKAFLDNLDPSLSNKEIYKQPMVGRLTIGGMLEFFEFHLDRHCHHIRKDYSIG